MSLNLKCHNHRLNTKLILTTLSIPIVSDVIRTAFKASNAAVKSIECSCGDDTTTPHQIDSRFHALFFDDSLSFFLFFIWCRCHEYVDDDRCIHFPYLFEFTMLFCCASVSVSVVDSPTVTYKITVMCVYEVRYRLIFINQALYLWVLSSFPIVISYFYLFVSLSLSLSLHLFHSLPKNKAETMDTHKMFAFLL